MSVLIKNKFVFELESDIIPRLKSVGFERNRYNIFDILQLNRKELKHSDFLAFLFCPNQSGEIGNQFLRLFLSLLASENNSLSINPITIFHSKFDNVIVRREYKNIDLLIEATTEKEKIVLVIENKVWSSERIGDNEKEGQLPKYKGIVNREYLGQTITSVFLYLTPDKTAPREDKEWIAIDYKFIYSVLSKLNLDNSDSTVRTLINDYRKMIRSEFDMPISADEQRIVNEIYAQYREIFEYINAHKPDRINITADIVRKYIQTNFGDKFEFESEKQSVNIAFRAKELRDNKNIYFQISTDDLTLYCFEDGKRGGGGKQWLFGDKKKTVEVIDKHQEYILNNNVKQLQAELEDKLNETFAPSGFIFTQSNDIYRRLRGDI